MRRELGPKTGRLRVVFDASHRETNRVPVSAVVRSFVDALRTCGYEGSARVEWSDTEVVETEATEGSVTVSGLTGGEPDAPVPTVKAAPKKRAPRKRS